MTWECAPMKYSVIKEMCKFFALLPSMQSKYIGSIPHAALFQYRDKRRGGYKPKH